MAAAVRIRFIVVAFSPTDGVLAHCCGEALFPQFKIAVVLHGRGGGEASSDNSEADNDGGQDGGSVFHFGCSFLKSL